MSENGENRDSYEGSEGQRDSYGEQRESYGEDGNIEAPQEAPQDSYDDKQADDEVAATVEDATPAAVAETTADNGSSSPSNHLELFVKAGTGKDGETLGGCPFCQRMFMILLTKANAGELTFTVTTVNMAKPPADFKKLSSRLPVIVHAGETLSDLDEMVRYIDETFPYPAMAYDNREAADATVSIFSKFSFFIKDVSHSSGPLLAELKKLNSYLEKSPHKFLCRDEIDHLDCMMLPKLQHIRVVSKAFKDFDIPAELTAFWRYMKNAYESEVFQQTCPSDQEIVQHWGAKPELPRLSAQQRKYFSVDDTEPRHSFEVPEGI